MTITPVSLDPLTPLIDDALKPDAPAIAIDAVSKKFGRGARAVRALDQGHPQRAGGASSSA